LVNELDDLSPITQKDSSKPAINRYNQDINSTLFRVVPD
jgi:hypothetical protein